MDDPADIRFFQILQQVLANNEEIGGESCRAAVAKAIASGMPLEMRAARAAIHALSAEERDKILAQIHARMAGDLSAIWNFLPAAQGSRKPN